jgi:hypothetical protein
LRTRFGKFQPYVRYHTDGFCACHYFSQLHTPGRMRTLIDWEMQTVEEIDTGIWQAFEQLAEGYPDDVDVRMIVNLAQWLQQDQPRLKDDSE